MSHSFMYRSPSEILRFHPIPPFIFFTVPLSRQGWSLTYSSSKAPRSPLTPQPQPLIVHSGIH